jgi:hypothetical protein
MKKLTKEQAEKQWNKMKNKSLFFHRYQLPEEMIGADNIFMDWLISQYGDISSVFPIFSDYWGLSESFISRNKDKFGKVQWMGLCTRNVLSEEFIKEHENYVCWKTISAHQKLSEPFIEKFSDKLEWIYIGYYQSLSKEFIVRNFDKFDISGLLESQKISSELKEELKLIHALS